MANPLRDPVLRDPGELVRFWLWFHVRQTFGSRVVLSDFARAIDVKPSTASWWVDKGGIPTQHWHAIAAYFDFENYRDLEAEAAKLWTDVDNRRDFVPLYKMQKKRKGAK